MSGCILKRMIPECRHSSPVDKISVVFPDEIHWTEPHRVLLTLQLCRCRISEYYTAILKLYDYYQHKDNYEGTYNEKEAWNLVVKC